MLVTRYYRVAKGIMIIVGFTLQFFILLDISL